MLHYKADGKTETAEKFRYNIITSFRTFLNWLKKGKFISKDTEFIELKRPQRKEPRAITQEQQFAILDNLPERHRYIYEIAMIFGLRPEEVVALQWDCVDIENEILTIRRSFSTPKEGVLETTKTNNIRPIIGWHPRASEIFLKMKSANKVIVRLKNPKGIHKRYKKLCTSPTFVFVNEGGGFYKTLDNNYWYDACKKAGVDINVYNACKHSLGCKLADGGAHDGLIRDTFGHKNTETSRIYFQRGGRMRGAAIANAWKTREEVEEEKERRKRGVVSVRRTTKIPFKI